MQKKEGVSPEFVREKVASGRVVILKNNKRDDVIPTAVGEGMTVKINANIGTSMERSNVQQELDKVRIIEATGADVLMDLSTGSDIDGTRKADYCRYKASYWYSAYVSGRGKRLLMSTRI